MKLSKTYEPGQFEADIYQLWEKNQAFAPSGQGEPYAIVLPPPNANGNLHVGHAYTTAIEDILIRYHRMNGRDTLWVPGSDHAGFETWVVFERALEVEGKSRFDFSRDDLYKMTWDFVQLQKGNMEGQMRRLGASVDWSRMTFTLDEKVIDRVYKTFRKMWNDGLIYRGKRIVNYCPQHQTSFADIEVEYVEEQGSLWEIKYLGADFDGELTVATTRPETMLGDEAIAVHPDDKKYQKLIGKHVTIPIIGKKIPVVADGAVELGFGTGAVKVTPAHDPLDFEIGARHNLPITEVIDHTGHMINVPDDFQGLTVTEARQKVVERLKAEGSLGKVSDFTHQVPHCYKCGTVIQPLAMEQWFVKVEPLAKRAKKALTQGEIRFLPTAKGRELVRYFDELRDWNISRQIPWGIAIPMFKLVGDAPGVKSSSTPPPEWIFDERIDQEYLEVDGRVYQRDPDTFDTWFSSGQWPVVLTEDAPQYYPLSVMETGADILRPWVARMIMLGLYINQQIPFRDVYLHGLILDEHGQKMSKSKNNVVNPMTVVDEYGSDALRLGLVMARSAGMAQAFSPDKVVAGRNFCNKLWNIARYLEQFDKKQPELTPADHWVLSKLQHLTKELDDLIKDYRFAEAVETLYHTIWDDVADWYIEASKQGSACAEQVLETILKLTHPFAPFITETIWTTLRQDDSLLIGQQWSHEFNYDAKKARDFEKIRSLVVATRKTVENLNGGKQTLVYQKSKLIAENEAFIKSLAGLNAIFPLEYPQGLRIPGPIAAWIAAKPAQIATYKAKLEQNLAEAVQTAQKLKSRLDNVSYVKNAPKNLVEETKTQLKAAENLVKALKTELEAL